MIHNKFVDLLCMIAIVLLGKKIILIGIVFDTESNSVSEIKYEFLEIEQ